MEADAELLHEMADKEVEKAGDDEVSEKEVQAQDSYVDRTIWMQTHKNSLTLFSPFQDLEACDAARANNVDCFHQIRFIENFSSMPYTNIVHDCS